MIVIKTAIATAVLALATASGASAANVLFSQNFDSLTQALGSTTVPGFTVTTGTIDIVTSGNFGINCVGNVGACLDIDGSPGPGTLLSNNVNFVAGKQVLVAFDVSGSQRDSAPDIFEFELLFGAPLTYNNNILSGFAFGNTGIYTNASSGTYNETIVFGRPFVTYTYGFIPTVSGSLQMRFASPSADNIGPVLDNVLVSQVPEPASWAMLIAGFGLVGAAARRRRMVATAA